MKKKHGGSKRVAVNIIVSVVVSGWMIALYHWVGLPMRTMALHADGIVLGGEPGEGRITLAASRLDGDAMIVLEDARGREALTLSITKQGYPAITFAAAIDKPVMALSVAQGQPWIQLRDPQSGEERWSLTLDAAGEPVITVQERETEPAGNIE